jgi:hypothetical protein
MIDVFLRSLGLQSPLRRGLFDATVARWRMEDVNLWFCWDKGIREARLWAEQNATSDPYIFTDDDVLPFGKDWLDRGTRILLAHPEYAIASTRSVIKEEMCSEGPGDIYEVRCVGAPMWIRKGILGPDVPELPFRDECILLDAYVRKKGYKEGIINGIMHHHLGFGCATDPTLVRCW